MEYQLSLLYEKKRRLEAKLARKAAAIKDFLYGRKKFITVKDELAQYDNVF